ncbi:hypothetical protein [Lentibacillus sp. Marseille-P4043]|uniref:hypothetical protein n=1 Tax=Lentibacillus sp. Marseille-P4043 TaxID=2040293 RepID=UPI000D0B8300|nr:hypothetical protein [Lentibacillus sp. Marseille-P4043]
MKVNFEDLKIDHVSLSSGIFSGENQQVDWNFVSKVNEGFGTISGSNNDSFNNHHVVRKRVDKNDCGKEA